MSESINCPFCGNIIESDVYKCPFCNALFSEPDLKEIKIKEFRIFLALEIFTFGLFSTIWFFINGKAINKMTGSIKDALKLNWLVILLVLNLGVYFFYLQHNSLILSITTFVQYIIYICLSYRVIRIVQKYTENKYGVTLEYNPYYIVFFNLLYMIHFLDTYTNRVLQKHEYFNFKSPQIVILIVILLILQFIHCLNPNVHEFYQWFFRF